MADGPAIYPQSYYGTSPLDKFVTGAVEGYGKMLDFQTKADALSMQLMENAKKREIYASTKADAATKGTASDSSDTTGAYYENAAPGIDAGTAAGGTGVGPTLQQGTGGKDNWETLHNNFAGMRKVGGPERGPNAGGFQEFQTPEQGVQAIHNQLDRYVSGATTGKPLTTIRQIVSTWAPPNQNPTEALIANASQVMGVDPNTPLNWGDPSVKAKMVETMIRNEQGGHLHPNAATAIPKVFGNANWQPYQRTQQAAIGGTQRAGAPPIPAAPSEAPSAAAPSGGGGSTPSVGAGGYGAGSPYYVPYYNPNTLMPGASPAALSRTMPAGAPGAQTYAPPPPPQVDYAALAAQQPQPQPYAALMPASNSGLFGQGYV